MAAMSNFERLDTNQRMSQAGQVTAGDWADVAGQAQQP